ncbi:hypothetical protein ABEL50_20795 [Escherichia coli]
MKFHNTCRVPIYFSQISTKIEELQRERKRVVEHLALLDKRLETLHSALQIMQTQDDTVLQLNSETYHKHKVRHQIYKKRPRYTIITYLKENAHREVSSHEIAQMLLDKEQSLDVVTERHINPIRQILNPLHQQGLVKKRVILRQTTYWQWVA